MNEKGEEAGQHQQQQHNRQVWVQAVEQTHRAPHACTYAATNSQTSMLPTAAGQAHNTPQARILPLNVTTVQLLSLTTKQLRPGRPCQHLPEAIKMMIEGCSRLDTAWRSCGKTFAPNRVEMFAANGDTESKTGNAVWLVV